MKHLRKIILLLITLCGFFPHAQANFIGNDTQNFNPSPSGLDFVTVHSTETLIPGVFNFNAFANSAKNSLPPTFDASGNKIQANDNVVFSDLSVAYGVSSHFDVGLSLSYLLSQQTDRNQIGAQFAGTGLNEIRLLGKYSLMKRDPIGAAIVLSMNINEALNNPFTGTDNGPTLNVEGAVEHKFGSLLVAGNLGYRFRQDGGPIPGAVYQPLPNQTIGSLAMSYYLTQADMKIIGEIYAAKASRSTAAVDQTQISSEFIVGAKYDLFESTALQAGGGARVGQGLFTPDWRVYVGCNFTFEAFARKPSTSIEIVQMVAPTPVPTPTPAPVPGAKPQNVIKISHVHGYLPEDIEALKETSFDEMAKNHEFQLRTTVPEKDFSGAKPPFEIIRLENFDFDFGSSKIKPEHYPQLDRLAAYIGSAPKVLKIKVEGHTDTIGSLERNKKRSQERAENVLAYLSRSGLLSGVEVEAVGYGAERPIADNGNFQGRKMNRRVEIRILRTLPAAPESFREKK